jgi:hypothetical protein
MNGRDLMRCLLYIAFLIMVYALAAIFIGGCKTQHVVGGTARHDSGAFAVVYTARDGGVVRVSDTRDSVATTQPSLTITGDKTSGGITAAPEGVARRRQLRGQRVQTNPNVVAADRHPRGVRGVLLPHAQHDRRDWLRRRHRARVCLPGGAGLDSVSGGGVGALRPAARRSCRS